MQKRALTTYNIKIKLSSNQNVHRHFIWEDIMTLFCVSGIFGLLHLGRNAYYTLYHQTTCDRIFPSLLLLCFKRFENGYFNCGFGCVLLWSTRVAAITMPKMEKPLAIWKWLQSQKNVVHPSVVWQIINKWKVFRTGMFNQIYSNIRPCNWET